LHHSILSLGLTFDLNFITIHDFLLDICLMLHELILLLLRLLLAINDVLEKRDVILILEEVPAVVQQFGFEVAQLHLDYVLLHGLNCVHECDHLND
jgi:hypothetical protein